MNLVFSSIWQSGYRTSIVVMLLFLTACATTNESKQFTNTDEIEISEEFGVDSDVRDNFEKAVELLGQDKNKEAIELLNKVTRDSQKHSAPYINLGIAYMRVNDPEEAEKNLLEALKISPLHPVANNEIGILYRRSGRFAEARAAYEKVVQKYPQYLPARKNLGVLCDLYIKDINCAIANYEEYLKAVPTDKEVKIWVAAAKQKAGR